MWNALFKIHSHDVQANSCGFCKVSFYFLKGFSNKLVPEFRWPIGLMFGLGIAFDTVSRFGNSHFDWTKKNKRERERKNYRTCVWKKEWNVNWNQIFGRLSSYLSGIQSHNGSASQYESIDELGVYVAGECICALPIWEIYLWPL